MKITAAGIRIEVLHLRELARQIGDAEALAEIQMLILEFERQARKLANGDAS